MDLDLLKKHVAEGTVNALSHPTLPLTIYNYSQRCQYDKLWDDVTLQCRGLVMHGDKVVARPFRKFFNDTEYAEGEIPWHLPCEVTEKLDGSLLIMFHFDGDWRFATRGSFTSEQSVEGRRIFAATCGSDIVLDPKATYLFEVIYPENRIVVDYGGERKVVLLGIIETESGTERSGPFPGFLNVRRLTMDAGVRSLRSLIRDEEEGYVVRFTNGFRIKIKGERYIKLHRLITLCSSRTIWEHVSQGTPFDDVLAAVPDEFMDWVRKERDALNEAFASLAQKTAHAVDSVRDLPDRKSKAIKIMSEFKDVSAAAFAAMDGKPFAAALWKQLYPEFRRPEMAVRMDV